MRRSRLRATRWAQRRASNELAPARLWGDHLLCTNAPAVHPSLSLDKLVDDYVAGTDECAFPVLDGERLAGVVVLEDIRRVPAHRWRETTAETIMAPLSVLGQARPDDLGSVLAPLVWDVRPPVPVVQHGRLLGIVRRRDVLGWLQAQPETPLVKQLS